VECRPHRNQRMILRPPRRVLSLLLSFPRSVLRLSISCMGCERSSGCCVILRSRFIGATPNLFPSLYARRRHPLTSFISHSLHTPPSLDLISCLRFPTITTPSLCVRPLIPLALAPIICSYYFDPFRCVYFLSDLFPFFLFIFPP